MHIFVYNLTTYLYYRGCPYEWIGKWSWKKKMIEYASISCFWKKKIVHIAYNGLEKVHFGMLYELVIVNRWLHSDVSSSDWLREMWVTQEWCISWWCVIFVYLAWNSAFFPQTKLLHHKLFIWLMTKFLPAQSSYYCLLCVLILSMPISPSM